MNNYLFIPKKNSGKSFLVRDLLLSLESKKLPEYFICDLELLTLGRTYNMFKFVNIYEDIFSVSYTVPNFYENDFFTHLDK